MTSDIQKSDGMNYAPKGKAAPVVAPGEFIFSVIALDHGHINGMCNGLTEAGATLKWVYDPDPKKVAEFLEKFPQAKAAQSEEQVLSDSSVALVASAAIPNMRGPLGIRVMNAGKDYFTDKAPFTTLGQLELAKDAVSRTGKKFMVYYSERLHVDSATYAGQLIEQGAIGRVLQIIGTGPHRLAADTRPEWFFKRECYGGILCDIGSHQIEQYLYFSGAKDAKIVHSQVANFNNPEYPELEDFGDCVLVGDNGTTGYFRVDWFTPSGLSTWGDGRLTIMGTDGYIELSKYVNVATDKTGDHVFLVNSDGEQHFEVAGKAGFPFFGKLVLDCINRTEIAMSQEHTFKAAELCLYAQLNASRL